MPRFGVWNVNSSRMTNGSHRDIARHAAELFIDEDLDALFLVECSIPTSVLLSAFPSQPLHYSVASGERFKVLARFDPRYMERQCLPIPSERYDIWRLHLPLHDEALLVLVHGLDKRNNSVRKQELFIEQVVSSIAYFETQLGHSRTLVFGDFNANPFESAVAGALGMHAVISKELAKSKPREMLGRTCPYFYNPMWSAYGARSRAPATYYFRGSDPHELYWHMLDQVVVRPLLIDRFDSNALQIVTDIRGKDLLTKHGIPNDRDFSDHLPLVFAVDLKNHPQAA
jgi:hypothetical protein